MHGCFTAAEINTVFEVIETVWPKLIDKSGKPLRPLRGYHNVAK